MRETVVIETPESWATSRSVTVARCGLELSTALTGVTSSVVAGS
jgi:hypothetical protein